MSAKDDDGQLSFGVIKDNVKEGSQNAQDTMAGLSVLARTIFAVLLLVVSAPAAMVVPLLRQRLGLAVILVHGPLGIMIASAATNAFRGRLVSLLFAVWTLALLVAVIVHLIRSLLRLFKPDGEHVHTFSLGQPRTRLHRLWFRVLGRHATDGVKVACFAEAPLLLVAAAILFAISLIQMTPAFLVPIACAMSIVLQAGIQVVKGAFRRARLLDKQLEQESLAADLEGYRGGFAHREVDGYAEIPW